MCGEVLLTSSPLTPHLPHLPPQSLVDKFRVLRQIHLYHCQSEDDAVLPALRAAGVAVGAAGCQADHDRHSEALDDVGQRMRDALMHVRRGTRHARDKVAGACSAALALCGSIFDHMMVEEEQVRGRRER